MKNLIQVGCTLSVVAAAATKSGDPVRQGVLFGIANFDAEIGDDLEITTEGVFDLKKATGQSWAVGDAVYWDGTNITTTAGSGNLLVGCAVSTQVSADTSGYVRLNGACPAALT